MSVFLDRVIDVLATELGGVQAALLRGSRQTPDQVDMWSDTDLLVVLRPGLDVDAGRFVRAIDGIGVIIGSELYSAPESVLYRTVMLFDSSLESLDATLCSYDEWVSTEAVKPQPSTIVYGHVETARRAVAPVAAYSFEAYESQVDHTWFKFIVAIKKFARNDNLIGMHLLLDLVREYLVVEMIGRDVRHATNVHRFGYREELPDAIKLSRIDELDTARIFDYIGALAFAYDRKLIENIGIYRSRYDHISAHLERSRRCLAGDPPR